MEFNQAMTLRERQKFAEGSNCGISSRDDRNNSFLWKKGASHGEQQHEFCQAIQKVSREVAKMKRRIPGGYVNDPLIVPPLPFQIYNKNNATDSNLNQNTFQIRDGLCGFRPQYVYTGTSIAGIRAVVANGNYEASLYCVGTDDIGGYVANGYNPALQYNQVGGVDFGKVTSANTGGSITLSQVDFAPYPVLICSSEPGSLNPPGVQIVIQPNAGQIFTVFFFIKIVDAAAKPYTELWASVYDPGRSPAISSFSKTIPNYDQTFAVGAISVGTGLTGGFTISQNQTGHLMNRYLEKSPMPTGNDGSAKFYGLPQVSRGRWTANNLSGKIIYPGDEVIDDTVSFAVGANPPGALFSVNKIWTYLGASGLGQVAVETASPATGKWIPTGLTPMP